MNAIDRVAIRIRIRFASSMSAVPCGLTAVLCAMALHAPGANAQDMGETVDVGETGFDIKRPVLASACPNGCPWGEIGDFVVEAMEPLGYEVILCRNCNREKGPPLVSTAGIPPELNTEDMFVGTTTRVDAPVDFGITSSSRLAWAHAGLHGYEADGPYSNLRLIAKIEDPSYLLAAVKVDSGITDLAQIAEQQLPLTILGGGSPITQPILDHYGITQEAVMSWGGTFLNATVAGQADDPPFDLVITENGSPANNPEAAYWTKITQRHAVRFLDFPETVLDQLAADETLGVERVMVKWGLLRGVDRPIPTVARSGHAVFAREDTSEQAAYDVAKAIDEHRAALKWFIRGYSYDSRTVWKNLDLPLHPGAERYYREVGYLPGAASDAGCSDAGASTTPSEAGAASEGCAVLGRGRSRAGASWLVALVPVLYWRRRRRPRKQKHGECPMGLCISHQRVIGIGCLMLAFAWAGCGDDASDDGESPDGGSPAADAGNAGAGEDSGMSSTGSGGDDCELVVADEDCDETLRPIVFVHGTFGSATEISNTAMLFGSNGYCQDRFVAIEYDSVLERDPAARLAEMIDQVIEDTGFEQIDLAGHSQGTGHSCTYLSTPENAAKVANYLNISGVCAGAGVPTLSLSSQNDGVGSSGSGPIHSSGDNVTQVTLEDEDHVALAGSKLAFAAMWEYLYGAEPEHTTIQCGQDPITIDGKSVTFGDNVPQPGTMIEAFEIDELDDPYERGEPALTIVADDEGHFNAQLKRNVRYEFRALNPDGTLAGYLYYGPFKRSNYLMRFLGEANSPVIRASSSDMVVRSPDHVGLVARYVAGSLRSDWGNSLKIDGMEILTDENAGMTDRVVGMFMYDADENGETDLGAVFGPSSFLVGTDVFLDASEPRFMEVEWTNEEGRTFMLKIPNWPSDQNLVSVVLPH